MTEQNKCEGCEHGLYLENGFHISDMMESKTRCTKDRYVSQEEKCYSCGGKGTYSQMTTEIGSEDLGGEGYQKPATIHNYPCKACNGTGLKPVIQQEGKKCFSSFSIDTLPEQYKCDTCSKEWTADEKTPICSTSPEETPIEERAYGTETFTKASFIEEAQEPTNCKDCGLAGMHNADHACDEKGKAKLAKAQEIIIVPSDRIDYCCECRKDHGYDCPRDWQSKEREAFENSGILTFLDGANVSMESESVFKWHISRLEAVRKEVMDEQNRINNSGRKLYQIGYAAALEEVIERVERIKYMNLDDDSFDKLKDGPFIEGLNTVLAALSSLAKTE